MNSRVALLSGCLIRGAAAVASAQDLGRVAFVGDSITQGGSSGAGASYNAPSYRYDLWKHLVDGGASFSFAGSQTGFYVNAAIPTPGYRWQAFANTHEGHFGWRAAWEDARVPLPAGRYDANNLGQGTVANWTGQSLTFNTADKGTLPYTGTTYVPDTVSIVVGINDLSDGTPAATTEGDIRTIVQQYQAANPNARVYVASVLNVSANHSLASTLNPAVNALDAGLAADAAGWSTSTSTVSFADVRGGFDATKMTYDNTHPNYAGERVVAANLAAALGAGPRDRTLRLATRSGAALASVNQMDTVPGTAAGAPLYRTGATGDWAKAGASVVALNAAGAASTLRSDWSLTPNQPYTVEAGLKMVGNGQANNDFVIWADDGASGAPAGFLRVYPDRLEWGYGGGAARLSLDFGDNTDAFHQFRVSYDGSTYAVWRDGGLIADGLAGDPSTAAGNFLQLGNFTGSETTSALLDDVGVQIGEAFAPVPEPSALILATIGAGTLLLVRPPHAWRCSV